MTESKLKPVRELKSKSTTLTAEEVRLSAKEICSSKEKARAFLHKIGLRHDAKGRPTVIPL